MSSETDYVSRQGDKAEIPVQADDVRVEDPIDENTADTDAQLERDDKDAIDKGNIIDERTRNAGPKGGYREPGDEEGIPTDD
ncbi:histone chaperone domain-containing protein [Ophiocordyceps camponoti-floridani]|uniref:Histone chaperone domain-containing protein n=1 Tax=Ophiocordyceps camponoti-floridani TaxID=2030778 RepID=A0A8H4Q0R9_9HYPO|nr:histone chaperone domain-containing protein [Ophiocordyceps camponoti-floridani]